MEETKDILSFGNSMSNTGEIVLYQPNDEIRLDVRLEAETVWLSQQQMALLFGVRENTITYHIKEIYKSLELQPLATTQKFRVVRSEGKRQIERSIDFYNLDMIISVGYRVNSINATMFRRWASSVLKNYILRGYAINNQLLVMQQQLETRFALQDGRLRALENQVTTHSEKIDFFVRTSLPPVEQVFFNGEFFSAHMALENLVKTATKRVVMVDGYIDALTLDILDTRAKGVTATIFTAGVGEGIKRLLDQHDKQKDKSPIEVKKWKKESHNRWLIADDTLYHCGHSFNATGKTLSAIVRLNRSPEDILQEMQ